MEGFCMLDKLQSCAWHPLELWLWRFPFTLFCIVRPEEYPTRQDSCVTLETSSYPWIICPALLPFFGAFSHSGFFIPLQQPNWKMQISHARAGLAVCLKPEFFAFTPSSISLFTPRNCHYCNSLKISFPASGGWPQSGVPFCWDQE